MSLLKRENWFVCLIITIATFSFSNILLAYMLKVLKKDAWYKKWQYWVGGLICLIFPFFLMLYVFVIQMTVHTASKLSVPGHEIYASPYSWIICLVVPILGWVLLTVMIIYLNVWIIVMLYKGKGEMYFEY